MSSVNSDTYSPRKQGQASTKRPQKIKIKLLQQLKPKRNLIRQTSLKVNNNTTLVFMNSLLMMMFPSNLTSSSSENSIKIGDLLSSKRMILWHSTTGG
jgi:hypothetical protein